jgi:F420-non-reducing hydrogenase iron-sulfur subunit
MTPPEKDKAPEKGKKAERKAPRASGAKAAGAKPRAKAAAKPRPEKAAAPKPVPKEFTPRIVVFACNWCSYAGADTAGVSRLQYSPHFRIIRVMCSGRVHPAFVLRAFELGADGVLVSGCLGVEEGRTRLEWISAAEGPKFARVINEFVEQVRALGPSRLVPRDRRLPEEAEEYAHASALAK